MSNTINADDGIISGIAGLKYSADTSGALVLQTNGTTAITISASQVVTFAGAVSLGALTTSGNLTFTGTGNRILGDFSNATIANRLLVQNSVTNGSTSLQTIPNGTSTTSGFLAFANSDPANTNYALIQATASYTAVQSAITGTGTYVPMIFSTGGSERMRIDTSGNVAIGNTSTNNRVLVYTAGATDSYLQVGNGSTGVGATQGFRVGTPAAGNAQLITDGAMLLSTGNVERMRIDTSGNLALGTTGNLNYSAKFKVYATSNQYAAEFYGSGTNGDARIVLANDYSSCALGTSSGNLLFFANGATTERMRLDSSGNLSIGATSGAGRVNLAVPSGGAWYSAKSAALTENLFGSDANGNAAIYTTGGTNVVALYTAGAERMRITSAGNVGIGTPSPGATLVTAGAIQVQVGSFPSTGNGMEFNFTGGNTGYIQGYDRGTATWRDIVLGANTLQFSTAGSEKMRITAAGGLAFGGATNYGSSGQVLKSNGDAVPTWGSAVSAGQIIQVLSTTKTSYFSTTSTSYTDVTGLSVTITPSSASNKILVTVTGFYGGGGGANGFGYGIVLRDATQLAVGDSRGSAQQTGMDLSVSNAGNIGDKANAFSYSYLDSPATTSATTYKLQIKSTVNTTAIGGSFSTSDGNRSNTPTTITVMEVKG